MLPLCADEGLGVIPWSPLARGLLTGKRATVRAKSDSLADDLYGQPGDDEVIAALHRLAETRGLPPAQIALAWLLGNPTVSAPIVGATKLAHLEDAIAAVEIKLTDDERKLLEAPYRPHAVRGWM